nr:MAG TPA: hypothetical protein [Caudoviricetes sp.]
MAGLLTRPNRRAFPVIAPVAGCGDLMGDSQQRVLSRIFTGFPFHPRRRTARNHFRVQKYIYFFIIIFFA